jgi:hypothetical protein
MLKNKTTLLLFLPLLALSACNGGLRVDDPVAKVGASTLYRYEVEQMLPEGLSEADSTVAAEHVVRQWIDDILVYEMAKKNIGDAEKIERMTEDYRRQLTIHLYQEQLLNEKLPLLSDDTATYRKRADYLRRLKDDLYDRAVKKGEVEFFRE